MAMMEIVSYARAHARACMLELENQAYVSVFIYGVWITLAQFVVSSRVGVPSGWDRMRERRSTSKPQSTCSNRWPWKRGKCRSS